MAIFNEVLRGFESASFLAGKIKAAPEGAAIGFTLG
jgi:hypothetical protein